MVSMASVPRKLCRAFNLQNRSKFQGGTIQYTEIRTKQNRNSRRLKIALELRSVGSDSRTNLSLDICILPNKSLGTVSRVAPC